MVSALEDWWSDTHVGATSALCAAAGLAILVLTMTKLGVLVGFLFFGLGLTGF